MTASAYYAETIEESDAAPVDVAVALAASGADVLVCYLPVGSEDAARYYAEQALKAGVAFVNCLRCHRRPSNGRALHQGRGADHRRRHPSRSAPPSSTAC